MKDYNNMGLDDLDIVDLDDEDTVGANAGEKAEIMENDSEEFVVEEPFVVPVENVIEDQNDTEEFIEEYDEADEAFGSAKPRREESDKEKVVPTGGFVDRLIHMDVMDKLIAGLGCLVLVLAIVALGIFMSYRASEGQLLTFTDIG